MQAATIIIADTDAILTEYLSGFLERRGHRVLIAPPTHAGVHETVRGFPADICLLDLTLRDGDDLDNLRRLVTDYPALLVVVRTADPSSELMHAALSAGAVGYVHKSRGAQLLIEVLTRVGDGEIVVEGSFCRTRNEQAEDTAYLMRQVGYLTPRERECLALLADGRNTTAIAAVLGISRTTVRSHVQALLGKLGVHSRLEAASIAVRCQLNADTPAQPSGSVSRVVPLHAPERGIPLVAGRQH